MLWEELPASLGGPELQNELSQFIHISTLTTTIQMERVDANGIDTLAKIRHADGRKDSAKFTAHFIVKNEGRHLGTINIPVVYVIPLVLAGLAGSKSLRKFMLVSTSGSVKSRTGTLNSTNLGSRNN